MDNRQIRTLQAFEHVLIFLQQHPVKPEPPLLDGMRTSLRASIDRVMALHPKQRASGHVLSGDSTNVGYLRKKLRRERMMPIVRIAKPLLKFAPGTAAALSVPHARADAYTVATAALKLADVLQPHTKLLLSAGYSKAFLQEFRHEARTLALTAKTADKARQLRSHATAKIAAELKKGMGTVTVIEGILMPHFAKNPSLESLWRNRRRVSARIGRPKARTQRATAS